MYRQVLSVTFKENIRNRIYHIAIMFGLILVFFSILLDVFAGEEKERIFIDFGLAVSEAVCLFSILFIGTGLIVDEIKTRSIYFPLSRPISRAGYLLSRSLGLLLSILMLLLLMTLLHIIFIIIKGATLSSNYFLTVLSTGLKLSLIGSVVIFFSIFSTAKSTAFIFSFLFWILGHFSKDLIMLAKRAATELTRYLIYIVHYLIPNFSILDWKNILDRPLPNTFVCISYVLVYSTVMMILAMLLFERKEL